MLFFGTTTYAAIEAQDLLNEQGITMDAMRVKAFPFNAEVQQFIDEHQSVFVVEQNRDAKFKSLLVNEMGVNPAKLTSILNSRSTSLLAFK